MNKFDFKKNWLPFTLGMLAALFACYSLYVSISILVSSFNALAESSGKNLANVGLVINGFVNLLLSLSSIGFLIYSSIVLTRNDSPRRALLASVLCIAVFTINYLNTFIISIFTLSDNAGQIINNFFSFLFMLSSLVLAIKILIIADKNLEIEDEDLNSTDEAQDDDITNDELDLEERKYYTN